MLDYPHVRSSYVCPLCYGSKQPGLVACWRCYHACGMRYGNAEAEGLIEQAEAVLCAAVESRIEEFNLNR
jgi:hypothetical protein